MRHGHLCFKRLKARRPPPDGPAGLTLPQKEQVYLACWLISIFFTIFRREAP